MTNVSYDTQVHTSGSGTSSYSQNITIASNSSRLLVVGIIYYHGASCSIASVTHNGKNLTLAKRLNSDAVSTTELWYLVAPDTGTNTVVVNTTESSGTRIVAFEVWSFYNVDQNTPIGVTTSASGSGGNSTGTITPTTTGSAIFDCIYVNGAGSPSGAPSSLVSPTQSFGFIESTNNFGMGDQFIASPTIGSSNSMAWSPNHTSPVWNWVAIEIKLHNPNLAQSVSDSLTISDSVIKVIAKNISDSMSLSDTISKNITKTISDTLGLTDTIHSNRASSAVSDNILLTDTVSVSKVIIRSVVDNLSVGDSTSKLLSKQINDNITLSDTLSKNINKILSDNISIVDIVSKNITKLIVDNPSFLDSTNQTKTFIRQLTDSLSVIESLVFAKQITRQVTDNLLMGDSIAKQIGKLLVDNPQLSEQLSKMIGKIITDNISIPDSLAKSIGSILLNQTRRINLNNTTQQVIAEGKVRNVTI